MMTRLARGAGRSSTVFISSRRRTSLSLSRSLLCEREHESDADVGVAMPRKTASVVYENEAKEREGEREREKRARRREKRKRLGERFVGTKGRRRDGADSAERRASRRLLASLLYRVAASTSLTIHAALSPFTRTAEKRRPATRFRPLRFLHPSPPPSRLGLLVSSISPRAKFAFQFRSPPRERACFSPNIRARWWHTRPACACRPYVPRTRV